MDASLLERALCIAREDPAPLVAIVGPTASGKTELAVAMAEALGGEIVSADSVQIYRRFDVGSGKPSADERARAAHHLIGALGPLEKVDAASYAELASAAVADIRARGKRAIVCGGTFLWVKALVFGLAEAPAADLEVRARHRRMALEGGRGAIHAALAKVDPKSAGRLHPNDAVRVSRALEVFELTGTPMSHIQLEHGFARARHPARFLALAHTPETLTARIEARVESWLAAGWIDEARALAVEGYGDARAMSSVGYREITAHLRGEIPREALPLAIVRATRVFARRQRTWLNHVPVEWLGG